MIDPRSRLLIVGLGNPGKKYALTRHNLGFLVVEQLACELCCSWHQEHAFLAKSCKGAFDQKEVHLLLPQTYMNESGWSIKRYLDYYKLAADSLMIVCDDTTLPFGQTRVRGQGSSGGHNGLKSVIFHLGTEQFARLRMGIGSRAEAQSLSDYVLADFNAEERAVLDAFIKQGTALLMQEIKLQT